MIESKQIEEGRLTAQMVRAMKQHEMVCHYTLMDEMLESPRAESIMHPGKYLCLPTRGDFKMILEGEGQKYEEQIKWKHDGPTYGKDGWDDRRLIFEDSPYTVKTEPAEGDVLECFTIYPHKGTGLHLLHGSRYSTGRVLSSTGLAVEIYQLSKYNRDELKDQRVYLLLASTPWDERDKEPAERKLTDFDYLRFFEVDYDRDVANGKRFQFHDKDKDGEYRDWYYMVVTTVYPDMGGDYCTEHEWHWGTRVTRRQEDADSYRDKNAPILYMDVEHIAV